MIDLSDLKPFTTLGIIVFIILIIYLIVLLVEMFRDYIRNVKAKKIHKKYDNPPCPTKKEPRFTDNINTDFLNNTNVKYKIIIGSVGEVYGYKEEDIQKVEKEIVGSERLKGNLSHFYDEIARLNNRVEGLSKENIQLRNSKLMLRRQNKVYKNEISKLKKELELVI